MARTTPKAATPADPPPDLVWLAGRFSAARSPTAVAVLFTLAGGERTGGVLAEAARMSRSTCSNILVGLRLTGLVARRRDGRHAVHSLTDLGRAVVAVAELGARWK